MSTTDKLNKVLESKKAIKKAIQDKGVEVGDKLSEYADAISSIESGGGDSLQEDTPEYALNLFYTNYNEGAPDIRNMGAFDTPNTIYFITTKSLYKLDTTSTFRYNGTNIKVYSVSIVDGKLVEGDIVYTDDRTAPAGYNIIKILNKPEDICIYKITGDKLTFFEPTEYISIVAGNVEGDGKTEIYLYNNQYIRCTVLKGDVFVSGINSLKITTSSTQLCSVFYATSLSITEAPFDVIGWAYKYQYFYPNEYKSIAFNSNRIPQGCILPSYKTYNVDCSNWNLTGATGGKYFFNNLYYAKKIDLSHLNDTKFDNLLAIFADCSCLTEIIGLNELGTNKITSLDTAFRGCTMLKEINISNWSMDNATLNQAFYNCNSLETLKLPDLSATKTSNLSLTFANCTRLKELDLSTMDNSGITNSNYFNNTFSGDRSLETLKVSNFKIGAGNMFVNCIALKNIVGSVVITVAISFNSSPLTRESALVLINGLTDRTGSTALELTLHANTKALLTDEDIAIATAKNWTIA